MLPVLPVTAIAELAFPPAVSLAGLEVRVGTLALAATLLVSLLLAARIAHRTPTDPSLPLGDASLDTGTPRLRADDLLILAVSAIPGAVAGGRLGFGLVHLDVFGATPGALLDPARGGLELPLAIVGGTLTAVLAAVVIGAPVRRWLHVATLPLLVAIAGGKLATALDGAGQGLPFDGAWATAYAGVGPWGSLAPAVPSHPAQLYEALVACAVLVVLGGALAAGAFRARRGGAFAVAIAAWAIGRTVAATTWRDPAVLGPLRADQVVSLVLAAAALAALAIDFRLGRPGSARPSDSPGSPEPAGAPAPSEAAG
jgi:prolipoprotein diacylglyceryltransferase